MLQTVKVISPDTLMFEDGHVEERRATPMYPPPKKGLRWHPGLGEYIHERLFDEFPFVVEIEVDKAEEDVQPVRDSFDKKAFENYLSGK